MRNLDNHITGHYGEDSVGSDTGIDYDGQGRVSSVFVNGDEFTLDDFFDEYMSSQNTIKRLEKQVHDLKMQVKSSQKQNNML